MVRNEDRSHERHCIAPLFRLPCAARGVASRSPQARRPFPLALRRRHAVAPTPGGARRRPPAVAVRRAPDRRHRAPDDRAVDARRALLVLTGAPPMSDTVLVDRRDGVALVTLNRPDKLNALD